MLHRFVAIMFACLLATPALLLAATPVNINQADASSIAKSLDGIGQSKAEAIVAWRDAHGPFKQVDDLGQVKGIGKATIDRNRDAILLADGKTPAATKASTGSKHKHAKASVEDTGDKQ